jgi:hypothetical protein
MKKLIYLAALLFMSSWVKAQEKELMVIEKSKVPQAVVDAFTKDFPNVTVKSWQILPQASLSQHEDWWFSEPRDASDIPMNYYTIKFSGENRSAVVTYSQKGKLVISKEVIKNTALPRTVLATLLTDYEGWAIAKSQVIIKNLDQVFYKVQVTKEGKEKILRFSNDGKVIEKLPRGV